MRVLLPALLLLSACDEGEELVWAQFNAAGDTMDVVVGAPEEGEPVTIDIHSSTGRYVIGQATLTPGSGPIGTQHELLVQVGTQFDPGLADGVDAGEPLVERVKRVSARVDSGDLGVQSWDLTRDTAVRGTWVLELLSMGDPDAAPRTDTLTVFLWEALPESEAAGTNTESMEDGE